MIVNVTYDMFELAFQVAGKGHQYSREAFLAIYDHLNKEEGESYELDIDNICNNYMEFNNKQEAYEYHNLDNYEELINLTSTIELANNHVIVKQWP
jgi:hypothetical protein